jgi:hypothetical protein
MTHVSDLEIQRDFIKRGMGFPSRSTKKVRTIRMSDEAWEGLERMALHFKIHTWRGGNVSAMIEAIGTGVFTISLQGEDKDD